MPQERIRSNGVQNGSFFCGLLPLAYSGIVIAYYLEWIYYIYN
jgi:hypothetical protein